MDIRRVGDITTVGGEGPSWSVAEQVLYLVDGGGHRVCRYDPATNRTDCWPTPGFTSVATTTATGGLLVAVAHTLYDLDRETGSFRALFEAGLRSGTQFADGKVDRQGRLIVTTSARNFADPHGAIFRFDYNGLHPLDDNYILSNGPCWSPDGRTFYCADSKAFTIFAYDYDTASGVLANRRVFATTRDIGGIADGATVDANGRLWMAFCVVGKIACFAPDGGLVQLIDFPANGCTSLMFGGAALDRLFVTTMDVSRFGHPKCETAGQLFAIDGLGVRGLPEVPARL